MLATGGGLARCDWTTLPENGLLSREASAAVQGDLREVGSVGRGSQLEVGLTNSWVANSLIFHLVLK